MKRISGLTLLNALVTLAWLTGAPAHAIILVTNPSFDPPAEDTSDNPWPGYGPISDWTRVGNSGVNDISLPFLNQAAHSGTHVAFIQRDGTISQSISGLDPSKTYTATYFVSERGFTGSGAPATSTSVSLDGGTTSYSQPQNILKTDAFRRIVSGPLAVSGASSTLHINAADVSGDNTLLIDTVSITRAVPVVPDGGFENPVQPSGTWALGNGGGGGTLVGSQWNFGTTPSGITDNGSAFTPPAAPEGSQAAILRGNTEFSTILGGFEAGVSYTLGFAAAGRVGGLGPTEFQVLLGGATLQFAGNLSLTPTVGAYQFFTSDPFITPGGSLGLVFDGLTPGDLTTFIDDVHINFYSEAAIVPEPSALPLLMIGGVILSACFRRNRNPRPACPEGE